MKKEGPGVLLRGEDVKQIDNEGEEEVRHFAGGCDGGVGGVRHRKPVAQLALRITGQAK